MSLSTGGRQQLYTRLAPVIGEQEAETLLDQFPSTNDAQLATVADLKAEVARLDHRIDLLETRVDAGFEVMRGDMAARFERMEKTMHRALRTQLIWMMATIVTVLGLAARTNILG